MAKTEVDENTGILWVQSERRGEERKEMWDAGGWYGYATAGGTGHPGLSVSTPTSFIGSGNFLVWRTGSASHKPLQARNGEMFH